MARVFENDKSIMIEPVFNRTDFILCRVPVPKGYPQSQTHVGVGLFNNKFLTSSPFPNYQRNKYLVYLLAIIKKLSFGYLNFLYRGEDFENPCLYIEEKRNEKGIPINFKLIGKSPLMQKPIDKYGLGSYCSDPDLFIMGDEFHILNRTSVRKKKDGSPKEKYETSVYLIQGTIDKDIFVKSGETVLFSEQDASPCLTYYNGEYVYFSLDTNSYNTGEECFALYLRRSDNPQKGWSPKEEVTIVKNGYEPWHMSVFHNKDVLYAVIACVEKGKPGRCWSMLGKFSSDLSELFIYNTPLTDFNSYRSSAFVTEDDRFLLYNSVVNECIKGGASVDGREIVVASMDFENLLSRISYCE